MDTSMNRWRSLAAVVLAGCVLGTASGFAQTVPDVEIVNVRKEFTASDAELLTIGDTVFLQVKVRNNGAATARVGVAAVGVDPSFHLGTETVVLASGRTAEMRLPVPIEPQRVSGGTFEATIFVTNGVHTAGAGLLELLYRDGNLANHSYTYTAVAAYSVYRVRVELRSVEVHRDCDNGSDDPGEWHVELVAERNGVKLGQTGWPRIRGLAGGIDVDYTDLWEYAEINAGFTLRPPAPLELDLGEIDLRTDAPLRIIVDGVDDDSPLADDHIGRSVAELPISLLRRQREAGTIELSLGPANFRNLERGGTLGDCGPDPYEASVSVRLEPVY